MYLLDTNACIRLLNGNSRRVVERLARTDPSEIALCSVVKAELHYGARHSRDAAANLRTLRRFFSPFESFPYDDRASEVYGNLRAELAGAGAPIGPHDLMIAAIAVDRGLVLVTHNVREFSRVVGLELEDWES